MSLFYSLSHALDVARCQECRGAGKQHDAGPGDISFSEWTCPACGGLGITRVAIAEFQQFGADMGAFQ